MDTTWQLTVDCADPQAMVRFWSAALHYVPEPPPQGHASWRAYWQQLGVPAEELPPGAGDCPESIIDPSGRGPRIWFQQVPEVKAVKNRWHIDLTVGGGRAVPFAQRRERVRAEARRLEALGALVLAVHDEPAMGHFAIAMADVEGNEFDVV